MFKDLLLYSTAALCAMIAFIAIFAVGPPELHNVMLGDKHAAEGDISIEELSCSECFTLSYDELISKWYWETEVEANPNKNGDLVPWQDFLEENRTPGCRTHN